MQIVALVPDDVTTAPEGHDAHRFVGGLRGQQLFAEMAAMMRVVDVVTAPTDALAERFRSAGAADVRTIPNRLPPTFTRGRRLPEPGVPIGSAATPEHAWDFEQLGIRATLEQ